MLRRYRGVGLGVMEIGPGVNDVLIKCGKPGIAAVAARHRGQMT